MTDVQDYPVSSVPAAFYRGHLYSPDMSYMPYALNGRYDYRPGDLFEPMAEAPREPKAWAWWARNIARQEVPDFLGLRVGDEIDAIAGASTHVRATVVTTHRRGAVVRYPNPDGAENPYGSMTVSRRNIDGHWCP